MFDEYFDFVFKKKTCFNQVVYEWNRKKIKQLFNL